MDLIFEGIYYRRYVSLYACTPIYRETGKNTRIILLCSLAHLILPPELDIDNNEIDWTEVYVKGFPN